jgi:hypothetical protein
MKTKEEYLDLILEEYKRLKKNSGRDVLRLFAIIDMAQQEYCQEKLPD